MKRINPRPGMVVCTCTAGDTLTGTSRTPICGGCMRHTDKPERHPIRVRGEESGMNETRTELDALQDRSYVDRWGCASISCGMP